MSDREGEVAGRRVDAYLETIKRLEPDISMCDRDATLTSIAISLKRIADRLDNLSFVIEKWNDSTYIIRDK
jgi:hypothetical protein